MNMCVCVEGELVDHPTTLQCSYSVAKCGPSFLQFILGQDWGAGLVSE